MEFLLLKFPYKFICISLGYFNTKSSKNFIISVYFVNLFLVKCCLVQQFQNLGTLCYFLESWYAQGNKKQALSFIQTLKAIWTMSLKMFSLPLNSRPWGFLIKHHQCRMLEFCRYDFKKYLLTNRIIFSIIECRLFEKKFIWAN